MDNFFHFKLNGVGYKNIRNGLGHFLVEVMSMPGQKSLNLKLIFLHKMGNKSMQLLTARLTVVFVLRYEV